MNRVLGLVLLSTATALCGVAPVVAPPIDLSGVWSGGGWGVVRIEGNAGTYTDTYGTGPGTFQFEQTGARTYRGAWGESEKRHGEMWFTVMPHGHTIYGLYVADDDCTINPGSQAAFYLTKGPARSRRRHTAILAAPRERRVEVDTPLIDASQLPDDLVLSYTFDGDEGTAKDASGNGLAGSVRGAEPTAGVSGNALAFDGVSDYVAGPRLQVGSFSLAAWVAPDDTRINNRRVMLFDGMTNGYVTIQGNSRGGLGAYVDLGGGEEVEVNDYEYRLQPRSWTHVAVTCHDGDARLYVNGRLTQETTVASPGEFKGTLILGGTDRHRGAYWRGAIDDAVVFRRALSEEEVAELSAAHEPRDE